MSTFILTMSALVITLVILFSAACWMLWARKLVLALATWAVFAIFVHLVMLMVAYQQLVNLLLDAAESNMERWITAPIAALPTWAYDASAIAAIIFASAAAVAYVFQVTKMRSSKADNASDVAAAEEEDAANIAA